MERVGWSPGSLDDTKHKLLISFFFGSRIQVRSLSQYVFNVALQLIFIHIPKQLPTNTHLAQHDHIETEQARYLREPL